MARIDFHADAALVSELQKARKAKRGPRRISGVAAAVRVGHMAASGGGVSWRDLERYIGRNDLVRINYLERGLMAARAVCRISVSDEFGGGGAWATGFLITPRLMMTNHHVIGSADMARRSVAEFGYERDAGGQFRVSRRFRLEPERAFIADKPLDFAIVAVQETSEDGTCSLADYGFVRLIPERDKVEEMEFVTIIQHPNGDEKYIAVRENEVIKRGEPGNAARDDLLWYASDTAPGSSGSPAFNDSWQVVALHHSGIPVMKTEGGVIKVQLVSGDWVLKDEAERLPDDMIKYIANEGIRVSSIVNKTQELHNKQGAGCSELIQQFLDDIRGIRPLAGGSGRESVVGPDITQAPCRIAPAETALEGARKPKENIRPVSYYRGREGYIPGFLKVVVPLPDLTDKALAFGRQYRGAGAPKGRLDYMHFSVVFNTERRIAFYTAVNIDGKRWAGLERTNDVWYYDPRLPKELQIGDELYGDEPKKYGKKGWFDRGHLVRRLDPVWGGQKTAELANDDTFHWTNCSPQYWGFNQSEQLWQGLEDFILYNTDEEDVRASVFTGPIFGEDDEEHRGVLIPKFFWKLVVVQDKDGKLYASAYVVSQEKYATNIPFEKMPVGEFNNFQVSIKKLEQATGLAFPQVVRDADTKTSPDDTPLRSYGDIEHKRR
jgi:endonuclease G